MYHLYKELWWPGPHLGWRRGVAVGCQTCDQEVADSSLGRALRRKNSGQVSHTYSVSQKKVAPLKLFANIFTQVKYISVKFCQLVVSSYLHIFTNFGRFTLIFNKMALIFLGVPIVFNVFSFKFHQVDRPKFIANIEWSAVHPTSIHWIIRLGGNAGVLLQAATEAKNSSQVYRSL